MSEDEREDWDRRARELDATELADHAYTAGLALLQTIPFGGGLAQLLDDYLPRRKQRRVVEFVQELGREWQAHRDVMDEAFVRSDEFDSLAEDVIDRVQQVRSAEKQSYFAAILAGFATTERPEESDRQRILETLDAMRPIQIRILLVISETIEPRPGPFMGGIMDTLKWNMPDLDETVIREEWGELAGLAVTGYYPGGTASDTQGPGNLRAHVTPYGWRFLKAIRSA
jgi:hypothetical protein